MMPVIESAEELGVVVKLPFETMLALSVPERERRIEKALVDAQAAAIRSINRAERHGFTPSARAS